MKRQEGFIDVKGGKVWYEVVGNKKDTPLLVLHGGPGYPHDSLQNLEELAKNRPVIFYDQLGCGNSARPSDQSLWTVERFVDELQTIIKTLKLNKYHILGHSWGAGLGTAFALTKPKGLVSLIFSSPYISTPQWEKDAKRLLKEMPKLMQKVLEKGDLDSEEYKKASTEFYYRFIYRMREFPTGVLKAEHKFNSEIYNLMWGPAEFKASGTLKNFDLIPKLSQIKVPALLLCGRFDEATPESTAYFQKLIPNSQMEVFEKSAHFPMWNEKEKYLKTIREFLETVEKKT